MKSATKGVVVRLGRADTRRWEDAGRDGHDFRPLVREKARAFAARHDLRGSIEIYAAGGWTADVIEGRS